MCSDPANLGEAVPMVAAMACRIAAESSARALLIKGAPATAMGVRASRPSVDVDIWVDPLRFDDYLDHLAMTGWRKEPAPPDGVGWGHSVAMIHPDWASTIDVHRRFPGLLTDDVSAFEHAWSDRATALIAHQEVAVPSRAMAAAITVLHAARSKMSVEVAKDLARALAAAKSFSSDERAALGRLAAVTRSVEPLSDLLRAARCDVATRPAAPDAVRLRDWRVRSSVGDRPGGTWLLALRAATWRRRLRLVLVAPIPNEKDFAESGADRTPRGWLSASIYRWRRLAQALPGAVRAVREAVAARAD